MDLATRIRTELAEGKPPERIVDDLVASGMSRPTAQRLVDRGVSSPVAPPAAPSVEGDEAASDPGGKWALVRGAFFFSLGITITAVTYYLAKPGQKYTITYGMVIAGIGAFAHGLKRWSHSAHTTFPAALILAAFSVPMLAGGGLAWYKRPLTAGERIAQAIKKANAENEARLQQDEAKRRQDQAAEKVRIARAMSDLQDSVKADQLLIDYRPEMRCEGARFFGDRKTPDPDAEGNLENLVETDPDMSVRRCGIDALAAIGSKRSLSRALNKLSPYEEYRELVAYGRAKLN
jgi:hypothetical protein